MKQLVMEKRTFDIYKFMTSKKAMLFSGIVCAVPFVFKYAALLSWFGYIPCALLFCSQKLQNTVRNYFLKMFIFGFFFYVTGYSWLCELYPMDFIGFNRIQSLLVILLALTAIPALHALMLAAAATICRVLTLHASCSWRIFAFPCVICFTEYLQSLGALAFPWCRIFVTQSAFPALLQSASLFGSYFITYLVLLINALLAAMLIRPAHRKLLFAAACGLFCANLIFGAVRMAYMQSTFRDDSAPHFNAIVLQGNIPSDQKWNGSTADMFAHYLNLCDSALAETETETDNTSRGTLVLIPETALPVTFSAASPYVEALKRYVGEKNITFAAGAFSETKDGSGNSLFLFSPDGTVSAPYTKRHLVPFGEYLPYRPLFEKFLPALTQINVLAEDLVSGSDTAVFDSPMGKLGTLICYESIFPELARESICDGTEILLVSTNDSWFADSAALRHHLANAQMRAIENRVPVLRAANTGISALITPDGRTVAALGANQTGYLYARLPCTDGGTLYRRIGDILLVFAALYLILCALYSHIHSRNTK